MATNTVTTTFYILAKPLTYGKRITGVKATHLYQSKPSVPRGSIAIGVRLTIPVEVLEDWTPIIDLAVGEREIVPPVLEAIISGLVGKEA